MSFSEKVVKHAGLQCEEIFLFNMCLRHFHLFIYLVDDTSGSVNGILVGNYASTHMEGCTSVGKCQCVLECLITSDTDLSQIDLND